MGCTMGPRGYPRGIHLSGIPLGDNPAEIPRGDPPGGFPITFPLPFPWGPMGPMEAQGGPWALWTCVSPLKVEGDS